MAADVTLRTVNLTLGGGTRSSAARPIGHTPKADRQPANQTSLLPAVVADDLLERPARLGAGPAFRIAEG